MLAHARVGTTDIAQAKRFYIAVAEALGASMVVNRKGLIGFRGPEGALFLVGRPAEGEPNVANGSQVALAARSGALQSMAARHRCATLRSSATAQPEPGVASATRPA